MTGGVDMVRTKTNRDMFDNVFGLPNLFKSYIYLYTDNDLQEVEAHSGDTINQVKVAVQGCLNYGPDVVLINANERLPSASRHSKHGIAMRYLINGLLAGNGTGTKTISTIIPSTEGNTAVHRTTANAQFRQLVHEMQNGGVSVALADMGPGTFTEASKLPSYHSASTHAAAGPVWIWSMLCQCPF